MNNSPFEIISMVVSCLSDQKVEDTKLSINSAFSLMLTSHDYLEAVPHLMRLAEKRGKFFYRPSSLRDVNSPELLEVLHSNYNPDISPSTLVIFGKKNTKVFRKALELGCSALAGNTVDNFFLRRCFDSEGINYIHYRKTGKVISGNSSNVRRRLMF